MQKRILFLGGSYFQLPPIRYAKQQDYYIIVCDYLPNNPGKEYADEYHNISTTDKEAVLQVAQHTHIDGVVAYASDPAAPTAAYVAEQLNLPGNPYRSVEILSQKDLYRSFLVQHGFHTPAFSSFTSLVEAEAYLKKVHLPVMLKPADSSGSKGVSKIYHSHQLPDAFHNALLFSRAKRIIIESYVLRKGYQIAGDGFVQNGKLTFRCFGQEHFKHIKDHFVPIGESFPLLLPVAVQDKIHNEIERLLWLLEMQTGALNFDILLDAEDNVYLMEVGPRAGGNFISEVVQHATGVNLVAAIVDSALGLDRKPLEVSTTVHCCSSYILHSDTGGVFKQVAIHPNIRENIIESHIFLKEEMPVPSFQNSGGTIGCLLLKFNSADEMLQKMERIQEYIHVRVV